MVEVTSSKELCSLSYEGLSMRMQHDINCILDPNRSVRRSALDKLYKNLCSKVLLHDKETLEKIFQSNFKKPLLLCASEDKVESCREVSLQILQYFVDMELVMPSEENLHDFVHLLHARLGKLPYAEPTEEIRLTLLNIFCKYLRRLAIQCDSLTLRDVIPSLANALAKSAQDSYPDIKKSVSECIIILSRHWPSDVRLQFGTIVKALISNLGHQHSRVRISSLQALQAVVPCGTDALPALMSEFVEPALKKIMFDHSPNVRKQLIMLVSAWFCEVAQAREYHFWLFTILMSAMVDESSDVQNTSLYNLKALSEKWSVTMSEIKLSDADKAHDRSQAQSKMDEFICSTEAKKLAISTISDANMQYLLAKAVDWTVVVRVKYLKIFSVYLALIGSHVNAYVEKIYDTLATICHDDEQAVVQAVQDVCKVLGSYGHPELTVGTLLRMESAQGHITKLSKISGEKVGQDTMQHKRYGLALAGMTFQGMNELELSMHLNQILTCLTKTSIRIFDCGDLTREFAEVLCVMITNCPRTLTENGEQQYQIFCLLNDILAGSNEESLSNELANKGMLDLAVSSSTSVEHLYNIHMSRMLESISFPQNRETSWHKTNPDCIRFDSFCRRGKTAVGENVDRITAMILLHLNPSQDADMRLSFLALLQTLLQESSACMAFALRACQLITEGIAPNIIWQAGRVAATIRKVAMACLYTLLRQGLAEKSPIHEIAPQLLPVLKSCLDENDASTRRLVCLTLQYLFATLSGDIEGESVHQMYADILKRLDDSNDTVRKAACKTFIALLLAAPAECFRGTIIDYTLDSLFIHLDDPDETIQEAVFEVLRHTVPIDKALVVKKANESRDRFRYPRFCDELLKVATGA